MLVISKPGATTHLSEQALIRAPQPVTIRFMASLGMATTSWWITKQLLTMFSSNANYPYCGTISFSDIGYESFYCAAQRSQLFMAIVTPTTTSTVDIVTTVATTVKTTMTLDETTTVRSGVAHCSSTGHGGGDNCHGADEEGSTSTTEIASGVFGGVASPAVAAALLFLLRRQGGGPKRYQPSYPSVSWVCEQLRAKPNAQHIRIQQLAEIYLRHLPTPMQWRCPVV